MKNEFVNELKSEVTEYGTALTEAGKLRIISVVSRLLGLFLLLFTIMLLVLFALSLGAVAIIHALSNHMPIWMAALILGAFYLVLIALTVVFRKQLFIHPFIHTMTKDVKTEEELEKKTMEADHQAQLQRVRIENRVDNATREFNFYMGFGLRLWNFIKSKFHK